MFLGMIFISFPKSKKTLLKIWALGKEIEDVLFFISILFSSVMNYYIFYYTLSVYYVFNIMRKCIELSIEKLKCFKVNI